MLTEPVTSPKRDFGKLMAGISSAIVVFLFRYFGGFEMGFASALIVMNVFSPIFDAVCENILHVFRHRNAIAISFMKDIKKLSAKKEKEQPAVNTAENKKENENASEEEITEVDLTSENEENGKEEAVK